jgi:hypothetical protein
MRFRTTATAVLSLTLVSPASLGKAQTTAERFHGASLTESRERVKSGRASSQASRLGQEIAPGIVVATNLGLEAGYDSNPDELFSNASVTPFGLLDGSMVLAFISARGVTTFGVRGSLLEYSNDILNESRWDASFVIDNSYRLREGLQSNFGAYYLRDEIRLIPSDNIGGYSELRYESPKLEMYLRSSAEQIEYLGPIPFERSVPVALLPVVRNGEFNVRRLESSAGFLFGRDQRVGAYAQVGSADLEYIDQRIESLIDRDAWEIWGIAGLRINLSQQMRLDIGYRHNHRDIDDARVPEHSNGFLDAKLVWSPLANFGIVADIDRVLVEPVTANALVGEQTSYALRSVYRPTERWEVSAFGRFRELKQIGDQFRYEERSVGAATGYGVAPNMEVYGIVDLKSVRENSTSSEYDRIRVGVGTRLKY